MAFLDWFWKREKGIFGSAEFLKGRAKKNLLNQKHNGLVIDGINRIAVEKSFQHSLIIAPTGAGKTTCFIIPNVLNLNSSMVITDPSGEIYRKTSGNLSKRGFKLKVINLENPELSLKTNPIYRAKTHTQIKTLTESIIENRFPNAKGEQIFWNSGGAQCLNILIRCLKQEPEKFQNFHNLRYLLNMFGANGEKLNSFIARNTQNDEMTFQEWSGFISNDEKVKQGYLATAKMALEPFSDPELCKLTAEENLHFETLRSEKTALFIIVPEHKVKYYSFFLNLLYSQIFDFCMQSPESNSLYFPIFFLLDEFGNTGKLPNFSTMMTTLRKRQCSCSLVLQDIEQLTEIYGRADTSTIVNGGCANRIFFSGLGLKTCEELERLLGKATLTLTEGGMRSVGTEAERVKDRQVGRALLTADEIRTMKDNQAIFIHGNKRPVLLNVTPYYRNKKLLEQMKLLPFENSKNLEFLSLS